MIMRYVCNSVPEDDRSVGLGSLLISLLCRSEGGESPLIPGLLQRGLRGNAPRYAAWNVCQLGSIPHRGAEQEPKSVAGYLCGLALYGLCDVLRET